MRISSRELDRIKVKENMNESSVAVNHEISWKRVVTNYTCTINSKDYCSFNKITLPSFKINGTNSCTCDVIISFFGDLHSATIHIHMHVNKVPPPSQIIVKNVKMLWNTIRDNQAPLLDNETTFTSLCEYIPNIDCCQLQFCLSEYKDIKNLDKFQIKFLIQYIYVIAKEDRKEKMYSTINGLCRHFENLFTMKKFTDVKIIVNDIEFTAHRAVLAQYPAFMSMLVNAAMKENITTLCLEDIQPNVFAIVLEFLYLGQFPSLPKCNQKIEDLLNELLTAAVMYQIEDMKTVLSYMMIEKLNIKNVIDFLIKANKYNAGILKEHCLDFIYENYENIKQDESFKKTMISNPALAVELLFLF